MIFKRLDSLSKTVAVDFGTSMTRVWEKGRGLVVEQPTYLTIDSISRKVLAFGQDAQEMAGRVAANVQVFRPIQKGQLWDSEIAKLYLQALLKDVLGRSFFNPTLVFSVPFSLRQALEDEIVKLGYALGAREVLTVAQPLAAAIGAGMPVADASGGFILQLGAGVNEAGVVSLGTLVGVESSYLAGERFEQAVVLAVKNSHQVTVSTETARMLIKTLASLNVENKTSALVTGKSTKTSAPKEVQLTGEDLREPTEVMAVEYTRLIKDLLRKIPAELTVDIVDKGLLLSGGGAKLTGLEEYLVPQLGVPVSVVDDPDKAVIRGMGAIVENLEDFRRSLGYQQ